MKSHHEVLFSIKLFHLGIPTIEETPPHRSKCSILPKLARTQLAILSVTQRGMTGNEVNGSSPFITRVGRPHSIIGDGSSFIIAWMLLSWLDAIMASSVARRAVGWDGTCQPERQTQSMVGEGVCGAESAWRC